MILLRPRFTRLLWPSLLGVVALAVAGAQEQQARLVKDSNRGPGDFRASIDWVMPLGGGERVVFPMNTLAEGQELWTSDGTPLGTRLLKDIGPGTVGSFPDDPVAFGEGSGAKVAFKGSYWLAKGGVWVTDGTARGTVKVFQGPAYGEDGEIELRAGTTTGVFFESWDRSQEDPYELLFTDGTAAGTRALNPVEGEGRAKFSMPHASATSGSWYYFLANEDEVWRSDGTEAGTTKVATVTQGAARKIAVAGERVFIEVRLSAGTSELWSCPMEGGPLVKLAPVGRIFSALMEMVAVGNEVFFPVQNIYTGHELWASNGTPAGTREIPLMHEGSYFGSWLDPGLTRWQGSLYLTAYQRDSTTRELWRVEGATSATSRVMTVSTGAIDLSPHEAATRDFLYFHVSRTDGQWDLWRTSGDAASTTAVTGAPPCDPGNATGPTVAEAGSGILFAAGQETPEEALWRRRGESPRAVRMTRPEKTNGSGAVRAFPDGTPFAMLGRKLLAFVNTGGSQELWKMNPNGSGARSVWMAPSPMESHGALSFQGITDSGMIFTYYDGGNTRQVWVTDGTRGGTRMLADHGTIPGNPMMPMNFVKVGDVWFYAAYGSKGPDSSALWKTDGTPEGTTYVVNTDGIPPSPLIDGMAVFDGRLYLLAADWRLKNSLWSTDGTPEGTVKLKDTWYGQSGESTMDLSAAGGRLVFFVKRNFTVNVWQSDGTAAGTVAVDPPVTFDSWSVGPARDVGGAALFQARESAEGAIVKWWRLDETGTHPVEPAAGSFYLPQWIEGAQWQAVAGSKLYYRGLDDDSNSMLWVTDGTSAGTRQVTSTHAGPYGIDSIVAVGDDVYFMAHDEAHGYELWRSDGTAAGTVLVADIEPGRGDSMPGRMQALGKKLYFHADRRDIGRELFMINLPKR